MRKGSYHNAQLATGGRRVSVSSLGEPVRPNMANPTKERDLLASLCA